MYICPVCDAEPGAHSFHKIHRKKDVEYYYTCPAQAKKYKDVEGIVKHYDGVLNQKDPDLQWMWIFDCSGFNVHHMMEYQVGIRLAQLITGKYSGKLQKIYIINPNWYIFSMVTVVWPFLSKSVRDCIVYEGNDTYEFQVEPIK